MPSVSVTHLHLRSTDPEAAVQWYVDFLDAQHVDTFTAASGQTHRALDMGGVRITVMDVPQGEDMPPASPAPQMGIDHFGLRVYGMEGLVARMEAAGVEVLEPIREGRNGTICYVKAPDNVRIELQEYAREP